MKIINKLFPFEAVVMLFPLGIVIWIGFIVMLFNLDSLITPSLPFGLLLAIIYTGLVCVYPALCVVIILIAISKS